jgi:predicted nucleic acid-binding Zn ribbon protein
MKTCPICGKPAPKGYDTCGNSYCQEAKFYRMMASNHRRKRAYYTELAERAIALGAMEQLQGKKD